MNVTLKDKTHLTITLRTWDGCNWSPETQADIDWLEHCPGCQEMSLDMQEV